MAVVDLIMPKLGESIMEATILKWHKQPGDPVKMDETVLEIATDKVDSEVPSTAEGVIEEILFNVNDVVPIGTAIARIRVGAAEPAQASAAPSAPAAGDAPAAAAVETAPAVAVQTQTATAAARPASNGTANRFYSPLVLNIAASEGVSMVDLENIPGTGNEGRVTKKDILAFVEARKSGKTISTPVTVTDNRNAVAQPASKADVIATSTDNHVVSYSGNAEIIEMDRMRKLIAEHMVRSVHTSPHVTSFTEADVTNMVLWRDRVKKEFEKREGEKLTFTPLFIEAIVRCLKKYPWLNSSLDGNKIIVKKDINIGMAAALPSGNLIVPVIKNADQLNLVGLSKQVNGLANAARNNKLKPDDTQGGTFTLTNVGTFGSLMGTPIINQPQVAILAVGAIKKRPMVIETAQGDSIAIRHMMYLSMSYDHRIIDGALGATFLNAVAKELEQFDPARTI
ncbi:dihydrolipoamide acetyltransferase family protein [Pseudobacter ginsenosidimutans]|uniref:Dihydrolipoamide acetyltransferase component of pyruvate dehydrogenase complex n=1 Tax=Pseudobacter ginsenosidimutans TaxID=661488 RepID=A0A4Q7MFS3_9BACT|nr:dihydrolipoamide acetyltransferase family protein [Pseudobacter ginsenosidimutans]QEC45403.1 2-oxo acid dehydrogenase subunit E2 [Pseudobacter ginsenosidimutans]RZS66931.1 2-oxoglutarate dehydrogenase E2 component (dihydrolipoamide succinyltransferase) [Pseudobacter ginsenosidimutans]